MATDLAHARSHLCFTPLAAGISSWRCSMRRWRSAGSYQTHCLPYWTASFLAASTITCPTTSSRFLRGPGWGSALPRPGAALYAITPIPAPPTPMRQPVHLRARVLAVRDVPVGTGVGYNAPWRAERRSRIATAGIGYADGWHRSL